MACCIIAVSGDRTRRAQPREEGSDEEEKNRELRVAIYNVWKGDVVIRAPPRSRCRANRDGLPVNMGT
ncbi:hypothetical protein BHM03_00037561 [Ensete ventricosum]|nr:hypothetical protein BHM03_00037561 [Ensete ventricosum]